MIKSRRYHRRGGLTLVEVAVSIAILAMIALALMSATVPLTDASREQAIALDMDRQAGKFFAQLRRELRQSGQQADGADHVFSPASPFPSASTGPSSVGTVFQMRTGPEQSDWTSGVSYGLSASSPATFSGVPTTTSRFKVSRGADGLTNDVIDDVKSLQFTRNDANSVRVTLTLLRPAPKWTSGTPPPPIERTYNDVIQLMNRPE